MLWRQQGDKQMAQIRVKATKKYLARMQRTYDFVVDEKDFVDWFNDEERNGIDEEGNAVKHFISIEEIKAAGYGLDHLFEAYVDSAQRENVIDVEEGGEMNNNDLRYWDGGSTIVDVEQIGIGTIAETQVEEDPAPLAKVFITPNYYVSLENNVGATRPYGVYHWSNNNDHNEWRSKFAGLNHYANEKRAMSEFAKEVIHLQELAKKGDLWF